MTNAIASRLVCLLVAAAAPAPRSAAVDSGRQVVEYFHASGDVSVHGTVSNLDGVPRSTWTVARGTQKETFDQAIDARRFWSLIAGFSLPELRRYEVTGDDRRVDFVSFQVVSLIAIGADRQILTHRTFLVPPAPDSRKVVDWLRTLNVPPH